MTVLVDTNVLFYRFDPMGSAKQRIARELLSAAIRAVATYQLSWLDAHMRAYAEHYGLEEILSEDFSDGQLIGTVRIRNPFKDA